jgi:uncharacterized protein YigA (DUF484 family)
MARDLNGLSAESTEQVIKFSPKQQLSISADEAGQAVIAKIRKAAELSHETCDRAMALAHKLAMQLRGAEDRINRLEREVALFRDRAARAEGWLQAIHQEIEEKLMAPRSASDTEQNLVSPSNPNNSVELAADEARKGATTEGASNN